MNDLFVPEARAVGIGVDGPLPRPLYAFPQFGLLAMGIAAVALGLARAAIDALVAIAGGKTPQGSARPLAARASAQTDVSRAEAMLRSARAFYYEAIEHAWENACAHGRIEVEHRRDVRLATTHATRASAQAVDLMYDLGGGTSVYRSSPLQRIFRDVHVATQHMMVSPGTLELTGRLLLGLETDTSQL
jgi:alkylation response protein AidB-like acyl-CoA dehydrogenase